MAWQAPEPVKTFSIGFEDGQFDERPAAPSWPGAMEPIITNSS